MTFYKNKNLLKLAIILPLFFGFFLGFNNGNVSAISDKVVTFDINNQLTDGVVICEQDCSSYKYIIITNNLNASNTSRFNLRINTSNIATSTFSYFPKLSQNTIYTINGDLISLTLTTLNGMSSSVYGTNKSLTITLSENSPIPTPPSGSLSITENGTYDVSQYASVSVNIDNVTEIIEDPISNDFQKVFFKIVENIIPAFGILLVVWFGIDMLSSLIFGRGR